MPRELSLRHCREAHQDYTGNNRHNSLTSRLKLGLSNHLAATNLDSGQPPF